jgi:hypothetical protein
MNPGLFCEYRDIRYIVVEGPYYYHIKKTKME